MKMHRIVLAVVILVSVAAAAQAERIHANLIGYQEVPSVSTPASGEFTARISKDGQSIEWQMTFGNLIGTVLMSHIHMAQRGVNGSIVIWLCQTTANPAPAAVSALTQTCPQSGTISGTITTANVIASSTLSQQIAAGELDEVIAAIRAGVAYVNIHSAPNNGGGEIRGQIRASDDDHRDRR